MFGGLDGLKTYEKVLALLISVIIYYGGMVLVAYIFVTGMSFAIGGMYYGFGQVAGFTFLATVLVLGYTIGLTKTLQSLGYGKDK